jgi:threonine/homoserine/homoserine lactone efflux protein
MPYLVFLSEAVLISLSGVMAPGPITAVAVGRGSKSPHAGALVAIGHGIVEFPVMAAVFYGVGRLLQIPYVQSAIGILGAAFLAFMGVGMLRSVWRNDTELETRDRSPVLAGVVLSMGSPYFLIWWATVGAALVIRSMAFGVVGFLIFALAHWTCDLVWCYTLSGVSYKGGQFFGSKFQRAVFFACGVALLFFGAKLLMDTGLKLLA